MQNDVRLIAGLIVARHECTYVRHCKKCTNLYVLSSTGNAYDVISHRRLSGPRALPQYFGQVYAYARNLPRNSSFSAEITRNLTFE